MTCDATNTAASAYLNWIGSRNSAELTSQLNVNAAHAAESLSIRTAEHDDAIAAASAMKTEATALATADYNYLTDATTGIAAAAKTYDDTLAEAVDQKETKLAEAYQAYTVDNDSAAYSSAVQQANDKYQDALQADQRTYSTALAKADSTRGHAASDAHLTYAQAIVPSANARSSTDTDAGYTYQAATSTEFANLSAQHAELDKNYWLAKTASLMSMAAGFAAATATASPWGTYYAAQMAAYDAWSQSAAAAEASEATTIARADAGVDDQGAPTGGGEIGMAQAERDLLHATADADTSFAMAMANAQYTVGDAQAAALGASASLNTSFPQLEDASKLPDGYAVTTAPEGDFWSGGAGLGICYDAFSLCGAYGPGWAGLGWGYGTYNGYVSWAFSGLGTGLSYAAGFFGFAFTTAASEEVPPEFWDLPGEEKQVESADDPATDALVEPAAAPQIVAPQPTRTAELGMKAVEQWNRGITIGDVGAFSLGVVQGFGQGIAEGIPGMAVGGLWWAAKRQFRKAIDPATVMREDVEFYVKISRPIAEGVVNLPFAIINAKAMAGDVQDLLQREGTDIGQALLSGDRDALEAKIAQLSPLAQEALQTAQIVVAELGHYLIDNVDAKTLGKIVGQVVYEFVEDAAVTAALGAVEGASLGTATPLVGALGGAEVTAKAAKLTRVVNRLSKVPGFNLPVVVKALNRLQDVIHWMKKYPICFVAGTPVHTVEGLKNIEDVRVGDLVLSRNEKSPDAAPECRRVLSTVVTHPTRLYHVRVVIAGTKEFETITGTGEHPFYVIDRGAFVPAKELVQGDQLTLADGRTALVAEIGVEDAKSGESFTTYNFEVEGDHTYFVGKTGVWVHNEGTPCGKAFDIFLQAKKDGLGDVKALDKAHDFLRRASNLDSDFLNHVDDADKLIRNWLATALKNDYPDLDDGTARYIGKKKWLSPDTLPDNPGQVAELAEQGLGRVTPKQLAGIEEHHLLPQATKLTEQWQRLGIDIEDFKVAVDKEVHRLGPNGIHNKTFKEWQGGWVKNWQDFFDKDSTADKAKVFAHLNKMIEKYGLEY
jgi:hypothetical protein